METNSNHENGTVRENIVTTEDAAVKNDAVSKECVAEKISPTEIEAKIVKQVEFYFDDVNLPYDKFMMRETKTNDGWVKICVLANFKRLASISKDPAVIAASIKRATDSILEVDEANEKIRRKPDYPIPVADKDFLNELIERSVYCKGFPVTATMDDLLKFAATFGDKIITKVIPRRLKNNEFKGSLYFMFNSKEEAEKFLNLESVRYDNFELERKWERDYLSEKKRKYDDKIAKRDEKRKAATEKCLKKGYLIKADNLDENVTVNSIKTVCTGFEWNVTNVMMVREQKFAWIKLKPIKLAKDLLEEIADKKNDLNIIFSIPDKKTEQTVLNVLNDKKNETRVQYNRGSKGKR